MRKIWIMRNLPDKSIRVGEIAGVAAPVGRLSGPGDGAAAGGNPGKQRLHELRHNQRSSSSSMACLCATFCVEAAKYVAMKNFASFKKARVFVDVQNSPVNLSFSVETTWLTNPTEKPLLLLSRDL